MTKIKYIVTVEGDLGFAQKDTLDSIQANLKEGDSLSQVCFGTKTEEEALNEYISTLAPNDYTHIVIINDGSLLRDFASRVTEDYIKELDVVYLPTVELCNEASKGSVTFKGFLNTSLWKPYMAEETGVLDQSLSVKGADLMLYGALIPVSVVQKYKFKPEVKYYSFFEFLNRLVHMDVPVLGIPKVTLRCIKDYELKDISKEEKLAAWKIATTAYLTPVA